MSQDLSALKIDKSAKSGDGGSRWSSRWIIAGVLLFLLLGAARFIVSNWRREIEVRTVRVAAVNPAEAGARVVLNATGYIVAHHKIQLAAKVVGKVAWIGVEKGDKVKAGQPIVRLEDDEYRAQLRQAHGNLAALEARLKELRAGSRPEEIAASRANLEEARADLKNAEINLQRTERLAAEMVVSAQALDDAKARRDSLRQRVNSLERTYDLVRIGPRVELLEQARGQVEQARGQVAYYETQLTNTIIRAPINGTILERIVERGEFVTTGFVGDRGAKGYVVSLADLNDLQVELDINQNDFARLARDSKGVISVDAYPDRKYDGVIDEISPEANRQKATVQVKVKVINPDEYLRPEMNASVAFIADEKQESAAAAKPVIFIPLTAVKDGAVFVYLDGRAVRRPVKTAGSTPQGLRIEDGLIGGEDIIIEPGEEIKDGVKVRTK